MQQMKIVYNPKHGAPITRFIHEGIMVDPHYPDGFEVNGVRQRGLAQYDDSTADDICDTYGFLEVLTVDQAKGIAERKDPEFKCDFPECEFASTAKIGLEGHKRSHKGEKVEKTLVDASLIPVAGGRQVGTMARQVSTDERFGPELKAGLDADGVEWYGDGAVREQHGFSSVPATGKGHFVG